ncbi:hypothetical protein BDV29DRAFT_45336 [Aspergillus leporis]|uniref:MADS-box domain-containing protein n=1 Tax=Aspergillus leporis TaxID=41062 RepID=A0A5N5XA78_9EURO|nr:hypothetical protein BDV29DRAFT_45336 [Aspergillus leporis]
MLDTKIASEYSKMCDADVCLGIRIRDTGRVYMFSADASGFWESVGSQLDPIIQHQARSLTRTLASRETKSYLPLNRGETGNDLGSHGALRETFHPTSPPAVSKNWPHHLPGSFVYLQRETTNSGLQRPKVSQRSRPNSTPPESLAI